MNERNPARGKGRAGRRGQGRSPKPRPTDLWAAVPALPDAEAIEPAQDPTALLRSLGEPPLPGHGTVAQHYLTAVVERAAALAAALAASAGLLADPDED